MEDFLHYQTSKKSFFAIEGTQLLHQRCRIYPHARAATRGKVWKISHSTRLLYLFSFIEPLKYSSVSFSWCHYHPEETFKFKITENSLTKYYFRTEATGKTRTITNDDDNTDIRIPSVGIQENLLMGFDRPLTRLFILNGTQSNRMTPSPTGGIPKSTSTATHKNL